MISVVGPLSQDDVFYALDKLGWHPVYPVARSFGRAQLQGHYVVLGVPFDGLAQHLSDGAEWQLLGPVLGPDPHLLDVVLERQSDFCSLLVQHAGDGSGGEGVLQVVTNKLTHFAKCHRHIFHHRQL